MTNNILLRSWVRFTLINGLAAILAYTSALFVPLPEKVAIILAFSFGPFFMLAAFGLYRMIQAWKDSIILQVGTVFNIVGTAFATMMLVVQQTSFAFHERFKTQDLGTVTSDQLKWMFQEVNSIQLGMDMAWDIFISAGTFFLALSFYGHPILKRSFSISGMLVALLLLSFNLAYFPMPPGEAGSIDFGPFVALWYLAITIWILVKRNSFQ